MILTEPEGRPKSNLTSVEAAALFLSNGHTKDPNLAAMMGESKELDMDALFKSGLRRAMGFDFKVKIQPNKVLVYSTEGPKVSSHAKVKEGDLDELGHIINPELINRLVNACLVLRQRHEAVVLKRKRAYEVR